MEGRVAEQHHTRPSSCSQDNAEYLYIQAQLLYRQSDFDGAQRAMKRAVTLDRENAKYQDLLAEIESKNPGKKGPRKNADKGGLFGRIFGS
jgi:Flp pilus assembly protein TadD